MSLNANPRVVDATVLSGLSVSLFQLSGRVWGLDLGAYLPTTDYFFKGVCVLFAQ